ncbi:glycosyltransferase [Saccharopolyspora sp. NPDC002376]
MSAVQQLDVGSRASRRTATVDVVIPVYNEEHSLPGCLEVLSKHLTAGFPFSWIITIVDNASSDATLSVAHELAGAMDRVRVLHLDRKGRGLALRTAWGYKGDGPRLRQVLTNLTTATRDGWYRAWPGDHGGVGGSPQRPRGTPHESGRRQHFTPPTTPVLSGELPTFP